MGVILLEALGALLALVLIVWWTMFSGRPKGEPPARAVQPAPSAINEVRHGTTAEAEPSSNSPPPPVDKA